MTLEQYAEQAFGSGASFYLREIANPGEFDQLVTALLIEYRQRPAEPLNSGEEELLAAGLRKMRKREAQRFMQSKFDVPPDTLKSTPKSE